MKKKRICQLKIFVNHQNEHFQENYLLINKVPFPIKNMSRSRCEWIFRNSRYVQDWNNVVERLLMEKSRKKKKRPKKKKVAPEPVVTQKEFELEIDHRKGYEN